MTKSEVRSVRLPINLSDKISDTAHSIGVSSNSLMIDLLRRGLLTLDYVPHQKIKTLKQIQQMAKCLKNCKPLYEDKLK